MIVSYHNDHIKHNPYFLFVKILLNRIVGSTNTWSCHYNDVIMGTIASQTTSLAIVYSTVYSDPDQRKHQSPASLAFVRGIHQRPVNSPHKWPVTRKMFPLHDQTSSCRISVTSFKRNIISIIAVVLSNCFPSVCKYRRSFKKSDLDFKNKDVCKFIEVANTNN